MHFDIDPFSSVGAGPQGIIKCITMEMAFGKEKKKNFHSHFEF